jgi:hypothetical protein
VIGIDSNVGQAKFTIRRKVPRGFTADAMRQDDFRNLQSSKIRGQLEMFDLFRINQHACAAAKPMKNAIRPGPAASLIERNGPDEELPAIVNVGQVAKFFFHHCQVRLITNGQGPARQCTSVG